MNRRLKIVCIISASVLFSLALTYGAVRFVMTYMDNQYTSLHEGCAPRQKNHLLTVQNNVVTPSNIVADRCDTLTVKNMDTVNRMMAFGVHEKHVAYDGIEEKELSTGQSYTVTLVQKGSFKIHDHMDEEVGATFQVK